MLKITRSTVSDSVQLLKLEGKLLEPWVDELRQLCAPPRAQPSCVRLDLSAVTFVDAAGAKLLRDLLSRGITIAASSSFVAELLHKDES